MLARRSALSVPGSSQKMLAKAAGLPADEIVIDLEDGVAADAKDSARAMVAALLREGLDATAAVAVRVNAVDSEWCQADVRELVDQAASAVGSLVVPKVEQAEDLAWFERELDGTDIGLQALIETAAGLQRVGEIAEASQRLDALILGYADLAASLGRPGREDPPERWLYAQESVLVAARAAGVQAIDGPYLSIRDADGLRLRAEHVRELGYDGKWAVHPDQVPVLNDVFTPRPEELERAAAIVSALEGEERGAVELDGEMVDEASRKLALQLLARGEAAAS